MPPQKTTLRLGARGSLLSRMQSQLIATALIAVHQKTPTNLHIEIIIVSTTGDQIQDRPLHEFGGKGLFTKELEQALLRNDIDFAVHSFKDVPVTMPLVDTADLLIAAVPPREDPRDALLSLAAKNILDLPQRARVGTSSLRRQAQLLALRPDLQILPLRGNIDTRLRKLKAGDYDAIILATAGLTRANLLDPAIITPIDLTQMLPAACQGALALQCRRADAATRELLSALNDPHTLLATTLEREVVRLLNGDCHSPIAALATITNDSVHLQSAVATRNGQPPVIRAECKTTPTNALNAAPQVVNLLNAQGATELLKSSAS